MYSIIDIETTGGFSRKNKITEIVIINFDGHKIVDTFSTLIDPERSIPYNITYLTGITNDMVAGKPKFVEVAKKIVEMTEGNIFVAHNVQFDYSFIQNEFSELGFTFKRKKLCTVRLARKVLPGHKSYSLGKICSDLKIEIKGRHRAMGDAQATTTLLQIINKKDPFIISEMLKNEGSKTALPPKLPQKIFKDLPGTPGVYYFWNDDRALLYIGKAKNIKKRVSQHFKIKGRKTREIQFKTAIADITYVETGSELMALLLEAHEIKKLYPQYNIKLRKKSFPYILKSPEDDEGFVFLKGEHSKTTDYHIRFSTQRQIERAKEKIYGSAFGLELDSLNFEKDLAMFKKYLGKEKFNEKILNEVKKYDYPTDNFILKLPGRIAEEICLLKINEGEIRGADYIRDSNIVEQFKFEDNPDFRHILLANFPKLTPSPT